jgi:hypothetical protein
MNKNELQEQSDQTMSDQTIPDQVITDRAISDQTASDIMPKESALSESKSVTSGPGQKLQKISGLFRKNRLITAIVLIIIISTITFGLVNVFNGNISTFLPAGDSTDSILFNVKAEKETTAGISLDTGFKITTNRNLSAEEMKTFIKLTPTSEFTLKKLGAVSYHLTAPKFGKG